MKRNIPSKPALIFDFGNVLVDWNPHYLYRKLFDGDDQAVARFLKEIHFYEWNLQQDAGRSFDTAIAELCEKYPHHCELIKAYDKRYEESISGPIWPTVQILRELKDAGFSLYGLSNWPGRNGVKSVQSLSSSPGSTTSSFRAK